MRDLRKPNLFIIGAMKSGTTLLWKLLGSHPSVYMCTPKEPSYFVEPAQLCDLEPFLWSRGYWRSQELYLRLFQSPNDELFLGEASVYYTHLPQAPGVAERISRFNPNARLIYIIRDPIERTISHYWHRVIYNGEDRSLLRAVTEESRYRDVSYYAMQLMPYFNRFSRDQIKILIFEELIENHHETVNSVFRWLGLDTSITIPPITQENLTPDIVRQRAKWWSIVRRVAEKHSLLLNAVNCIPESVREHYGRGFSNRQINRRHVNIESAVRSLQPLQRRQTEELSQLIGRGFPEWKTLNSKTSEIHRI